MTVPTDQPPSLSPRALAVAGWIAFLLAGGLFFVLAWDVAGHEPIVNFDTAAILWFESHRTPALTTTMLAISTTHGVLAMSAWSIIFVLVLALQRQRWWMLTAVLGIGGAMLLNVGLKIAFERARPELDDPLVLLDTYSFPSGHVSGSTAFYGVLAAFLVSRTRSLPQRSAVILISILMILLVAISRMYLGAHYPSDVAAAMASTTAWTVMCLNAVHGLVRARMHEGSVHPR